MINITQQMVCDANHFKEVQNERTPRGEFREDTKTSVGGLGHTHPAV